MVEKEINKPEKEEPFPVAFDTAIVQQHPKGKTMGVNFSKRIRKNPLFPFVKGDLAKVTLMSNRKIEIELMDPAKA